MMHLGFLLISAREHSRKTHSTRIESQVFECHQQCLKGLISPNLPTIWVLLSLFILAKFTVLWYLKLL